MAKHHFTTNVLLKSIIGKDLINNDNIAVLELVKNSFDAGSKKVNVDFCNILDNDDDANSEYGSATSRVIIQDWGCGMDSADIVQRWLNIAYSEKKQNNVAHGRIMAGAKGIGRFSCDRLGVFLDLYTRKKGKQIIHLNVDWRKFEVEGDPDKRIESIEVDVKPMSDRDFSATTEFRRLDEGTILVISRMRSRWDEDKLLSLRRYLERLLNPNQSFSETGFALFLKAKEFSVAVNGRIQNQIFTRLDFTSTSIESTISNDGVTITTTLRDKGRDVFEIVERNRRFPLLKDIKIVIYYLNPYGKGYFKRMTGMDKVAFGSVFLFLNGFRVPPYGDENDDWLGLDRHKLQGTNRRLGTRELVGRIEVNDSKGNFKMVSSREGVVQDQRFLQITDRAEGFYFSVHRRLEKYVVEGLAWDSVPDEHLKQMLQQAGEKQWKFDPDKEIYSESEKTKALRILEVLDSVISAKKEDVISLTINTHLLKELSELEKDKAEEILNNFENITPELGRSTSEAMEQIKREFAKQVKAVARARTREAELSERLKKSEEDKSQLAQEIYFLRANSNVSDRGIAGLQHQIGISSDSIRRKVRELIRGIKLGKNGDELMPMVRSISLENRKVQAVSRYATSANFSMVEKSISSDIVRFVTQYVEKVFVELSEFRLLGSKMDIRVKSVSGTAFEAKFAPLELIIVIDNLLDNARKAKATAVEITFEVHDASLNISFRDNGVGIEPRNVERIFDFGFTTTEGSGIGLHQARQLLERNGGIKYQQPKGRGAEFVVTIRK